MMKKSVLKSLSLIMALLFLVGTLAACGSKPEQQAKKTDTKKVEEQSGEEAVEEAKIEGTVKIVFPGDAPKDLEAVKQAMEKKLEDDGLNLKLEFTYFPWDNYTTKINLIPASGESYDLVWTHTSWLAPLVSKNALLPLDEYLDGYGSDLKANIPEAAWIDSSIGGKIWGIPTVAPTAEYNNMVVIRGDLREKYGLPEIKTLADYEKYMEVCKENDPNILFEHGTRLLFREFGDVRLPYGDNGKGLAYIDPTDSELKVKNFYESDIFKNFVETINKWYKNGWLPKPDEIKDPDGAFCSGKLGSVWGAVGRSEEIRTRFNKGLPEGKMEEVMFNMDKPIYIYEAASNLISLFSTSENPEAAIAFMNWVRSSQENFDLMSFGVEGVNYNLDGSAVVTEGIAEEKSYNQISWAWTDLNFKRYSKDAEASYIEFVKNWDNGAVMAPTLGFKFDTEPVKSEIAQLDALQKEYVDPAYKGFLDYEEFYPEFQKKLKVAGIDKVIEEMQKQLDEFKASK